LQAQGYFIKPAARPTASVRSVAMWLPALAAAAIVGVVLFLWTERGVAPAGVLLPSTASVGSAGAVGAQFTFVSTRGTSTPDLELPSVGLIEFRAAPGMRGAASRYRMSLVRKDESGPQQSLGTLTDLTLGSDGYVHGYADATRLLPGRYVLRLDSVTTGARAPEPERFEFTLRPRSRQ
jgi:hypothetical protein